MAKPVDLDRRPGLQVERGICVVEQADDAQIPVVVFLVVKPAHDVHLGGARLHGLAAAGQDLLVAHHVAPLVAQVGPEGAERAAIDAHVRGIQVRVDIVVADVAVLPLADEVGKFAEFVEVDPFVPQRFGLCRIEPLPGLHLFADRVERRCHGTDHGGSSAGLWATTTSALPEPQRIDFRNSSKKKARIAGEKCRPGNHHQRSVAIAARSTRPITALAVKKASLTRERSSGRTSACSQARSATIAASATQ